MVLTFSAFQSLRLSSSRSFSLKMPHLVFNWWGTTCQGSVIHHLLQDSQALLVVAQRNFEGFTQLRLKQWMSVDNNRQFCIHNYFFISAGQLGWSYLLLVIFRFCYYVDVLRSQQYCSQCSPCQLRSLLKSQVEWF